MVKIVQRLRRGYGKSRLSITTIVVSQWSRYLLCKLLKAGWSKYFISFFQTMQIQNIFIPSILFNQIFFLILINSVVNTDVLNTCSKNILLQMQDLTKLQKMHFFIGDTFFRNLSFAAIRVKLMPPYTMPFHDTLCLISFLFVSR